MSNNIRLMLEIFANLLYIKRSILKDKVFEKVFRLIVFFNAIFYKSFFSPFSAAAFPPLILVSMPDLGRTDVALICNLANFLFPCFRSLGI
jgi:hypothetical protein